MTETNATLFLVFNHSFTKDQESDAFHSLGVSRIMGLPPDLQGAWSNIPPDPDGIREHLRPLQSWLLQHAKPGDHVLIQGDFGATYLMVQFALEKGLVPVYSTTERRATEELFPDGNVRLVHQFQHRRFRKYGD